MKQIRILFVAEPNVLPYFFSTIDSMLRCSDSESVKEEKEIVRCATLSGEVSAR